MATFLETITRIAAELRRSNLTAEIKNAINDAIKEAAQNRYYFNEMITNFNMAINVGDYTDPIENFVEVDSAYYLRGTTRYNIYPMNFLEYQERSQGNLQYGQPEYYSRDQGRFFLDPIPTFSGSLLLYGYGRLDPFPLAADGDTNAWLTEGELYIRALAKRNILRDVIRDYGEARALDTIAEDYKSALEQETTLKSETGVIRSTQF